MAEASSDFLIPPGAEMVINKGYERIRYSMDSEFRFFFKAVF